MTEKVELAALEMVVQLSVPLKVDTDYGPTWYEAH